MYDMRPEDIEGVGMPAVHTYFDGSSRLLMTTAEEVVFPTGELIVSQTDTVGVITMCNEAFVRMSGYRREELIGAQHSILRHPDMPQAAFADLWSTVSTGHRWSGYVKNLRKDGAYYWVYATVIPKVRGGQILGHTSVRRQPSRSKVDAARQLYATMLQQEKNSASTSVEAGEA